MRSLLFKGIPFLYFISIGSFLFSQHLEWVQTYGSLNEEEVSSMVQDSEKNIYLTGWANGSLDIDPGSEVFQCDPGELSDMFSSYLSKFTPDGEFLWGKNLGFFAKKMTMDSDDNLYITGRFYDTVDFDPGISEALAFAGQSSDVFICKFDANGNYIWHKTFGGSTNAHVYTMAIDGTGSLLITGLLNDTCDFDPSESVFNLTSSGICDTYVLKLSPDGEFIWAKSVSGPAENQPLSISIDRSDNILVCGFFYGTVDFNPASGAIFPLTSYGQSDAYVLKLNSAGEFSWAKKIGGSGHSTLYSIRTDQLNNVYVAGTFTGSIDANPGPGNLILSTAASNDGFLVKLDSLGLFFHGVQLNASSSAIPLHMQFDQDSNLLVTGVFGDTIDFDQTELLVAADSTSDIFVFKLNSSLEKINAISFGGNGPNSIYDFLISTNGSFYTCGSFSGNGNLDSSVASPISSLGLNDIFFAKYSLYNLGINDLADENLITLFPNPTSGKINIQMNEQQAKVNVSLLNALGKEIENRSFSNISTLEYEIPGESGVYFLKLSSGTENKTIKVIKN